MKFKVFTLSVLISALISTSAFAAINITVDNKPLKTDVSPVIIDGRTLVPVRSIFEELGADVIWNNETKTVSATKGATNIEITLVLYQDMLNSVEAHRIALFQPFHFSEYLLTYEL